MKKDKSDAVLAIVADVDNQNLTLTSYNRVNRALRVLGLTNGEAERVLEHMGYHYRRGSAGDVVSSPHGWLATAIAADARKRQARRTKAELP